MSFNQTINTSSTCANQNPVSGERLSSSSIVLASSNTTVPHHVKPQNNKMSTRRSFSQRKTSLVQYLRYPFTWTSRSSVCGTTESHNQSNRSAITHMSTAGDIQPSTDENMFTNNTTSQANVHSVWASRQSTRRSTTHRSLDRVSTGSSEGACRFCQESEPVNDLVSPCLCSGTLKLIHQSCLQRWIKTQDTRVCELCKYEFKMKVTVKPLRKWNKLDMSAVERRKIICSVTFHIIALTCVIWSLYVLIERTSEEVKRGHLEWPFWTKIVIIAIGFIGGIVFMYVQCRMYWVLCQKLRSFNRTFIIQNISCDEVEQAKIQNRQHIFETSTRGDAVVSDGEIRATHRIEEPVSTAAVNGDIPVQTVSDHNSTKMNSNVVMNDIPPDHCTVIMEQVLSDSSCHSGPDEKFYDANSVFSDDSVTVIQAGQSTIITSDHQSHQI